MERKLKDIDALEDADQADEILGLTPAGLSTTKKTRMNCNRQRGTGANAGTPLPFTSCLPEVHFSVNNGVSPYQTRKEVPCRRSTSPLKRSTVRRTLRRFWDVTRTQPLIVFLSVFSSAGYIFLLTFANTYVMALIVDRAQAGPVAGDQVFEVFGPDILALVLVNLVGQILSKLQDYAVYKLEIAGNYHLARLCFDTLSNQSMTFHTSRFGGSL